jgi:hypothetical protein
LWKNVVADRGRENARARPVRANPSDCLYLREWSHLPRNRSQVHVHLHRRALQRGLIRNHSKRLRVDERDAEFLAKLARERRQRRLAGVRLATGEIEDVRRRTLADQQNPLAVEDCRSYDTQGLDHGAIFADSAVDTAAQKPRMPRASHDERPKVPGGDQPAP